MSKIIRNLGKAVKVEILECSSRSKLEFKLAEEYLDVAKEGLTLSSKRKKTESGKIQFMADNVIPKKIQKVQQKNASKKAKIEKDVGSIMEVFNIIF